MNRVRDCIPYLSALVIFAVLSQLPSRWPVIADALDRHRAAYTRIPLRAHVEKQLFHIRREEWRLRGVEKTVITGSSAVINGIDGNLLSQLSVSAGDLPVVNYGLTGLLAYEPLMLKDDFAGGRTRRVVFGYNTFSFADRVHPDAITYRWDTREAVAHVQIPGTVADRAKTIAAGLMGQIFDVAVYHDFYREMALAALRRDLEPMNYEFDYPPGVEPPPRVWPRTLAKPAPMTQWYRAAYFDSEVRAGNMSYEALERFIELCTGRGVQVILLAMPEPDFSLYGEWKQGINPGAADANVATIAASGHAALIGRQSFADIEQDDLLWRDHIHLNERGRGIFTRRLATLLSTVER